jgi:copper chaperone CopZ
VNGTATTITVTGMTCDHCARAVRDELTRVPGVEAVDVDLTAGRVTFHAVGPVEPAAIRAAVEEAGYEVGR